jgi:phosphatidate cytidylyltransferase
MKQRVLTAAVALPVLLAAVWWGGGWLAALVALAAVLGIREFYRLLPSGESSLPVTLGALWVAALVFGGLVSGGPAGFLTISSVILGAGAFVSLLWLIAGYQGGRFWLAAAYLFGGGIYIGFLLAHGLALRELGDFEYLGRNWLLAALLIVFATDTGAFFTGRLLGKHRLAPSISPNKTWEGSAGGFCCAVISVLVIGRLLDLEIPVWQQAAVGAAVGVTAQGGDLLESKFKRISSVKDTGSIIPGHGGIMDRLDSIVVSIPTVYYLVGAVFKP